MANEPIRLVPAREGHKNDVVELFERLLVDAKAGKLTDVVIACRHDGDLCVSWAGKPSDLVGVAARALHIVNQRVDAAQGE